MVLKHRKHLCAGAVGIFLISPSFTSAAANEIAAIGPVEQTNCLAGTLKVLGIKFRVASRNFLSQICSTREAAAFRYVVLV